MLSKKGERNRSIQAIENNENFFWDLFLETGRIDAYLLLKEEESESKNEKKT